MVADATLHDLFARFARYDAAPALIAFERETARRWTFAELVRASASFAAALADRGISRGDRVALVAANSPAWVAAFWGTVIADATAMPLDPQLGEPELVRMLESTGCRFVFTTPSLIAQRPALALGRHVILPDTFVPAARETTPPYGTSPGAAADAVAVIVFTSGTTGTPKAVPLSHANLMANVRGLAREDLVGPRDRALVPLPLHHVYPLTVGMITPLASGAALIFPGGLSGPELKTALRAGGATVLLGVPKLYAALVEGIRAAASTGQAREARMLAPVLRASGWIARTTGLPVGRLLFARLHRELGPALRLLVSGGAALDPEIDTALRGFGWEVLSGYGLSETAPILAFTRRGRARPGTAGYALTGVALRIANADATGLGEIQARGPNVFSGYRGSPDATLAAFTPDGWFRTGDLGRLDHDGTLHVAARISETIVLPDGKKLFPEELEKAYAASPLIREIAVLMDAGALVGLVVPDLDTARIAGATRLEDLIRETLVAAARSLPAHARLSGFAIAREPLPRTQLGKIRRHLLADLYMRARRAREPAPAGPLAEADLALLAQPNAAAVWRWLAERFPGRALSLDMSPQLDLGVDSLGWIDLTLALQRRLGISLNEQQIARIVTLRDLLHEAAAAAARPAPDEPHAAALPRPSHARALAGAVIGAAIRLAMRLAFGVRPRGSDQLPAQGPYVLCPNHASYLDAFALAAALPPRTLERTYWAGWTGLLFARWWQRLFSRAAHVIPIDPDRATTTSLDLAAEVLARGLNLVWFPEGALSLDGTLQRFLPGVGVLLERVPVPVVPVWIDGSHAAWPPGQRLPRRRRITVHFGAPILPSALPAEGASRHQATADTIRDAVAALAAAGGTGNATRDVDMGQREPKPLD